MERSRAHARSGIAREQDRDVKGPTDFRLPSKEQFEAIRITIWNVFEIVLMLIAMAAVIIIALKHIP
jgi:hypothetical protein